MRSREYLGGSSDKRAKRKTVTVELGEEVQALLDALVEREQRLGEWNPRSASALIRRAIRQYHDWVIRGEVPVGF